MATRAPDRDRSPRRPTNVSLPSDTVARAKELGINVSKACEAGLTAEVKKEWERRWKEEHREAIEANNAWVEKHGLPLEKFRLF
jgi:antitoxin CcdA